MCANIFVESMYFVLLIVQYVEREWRGELACYAVVAEFVVSVEFCLLYDVFV